MAVSVVIIAKNEAHAIERCINSALQLTDNVLVIDTGSTDNTAALAATAGAKVVHSAWLGYGNTRNWGAPQAKYAWILSLDADETISPELAREIKQLPLNDNNVVYKIKRQNFFRQKKIRFGAWKNDQVLRLYNRNSTGWNQAPVHEDIELQNMQVTLLQQYIHHYTAKDFYSFIQKNLAYAQLSANKYAAAGKKAGTLKMYFSPLFNFLQGYVFRLGFLDGVEGWYIAKGNAFYTFMKYALLKEASANKEHT
ncbi:glycosyltransferase family 2 protein [Deminuibacter soli]|uniref:Glycosyltransferase family 2 protein n=1 Tax=Deminuibacter soli TaxID=2291815 RepID=A0A3E1NR75_9BACT|nr:glycosyltransferase family 2 protein [Deminuibacter soli]RFM30459.1 glycosyltransferase family 2 protein [Deminuibacter soli]